VLVKAEEAVIEPPEAIEIDPKFEGMPVCEVRVEESDSPIGADEAADALRNASAVSLVEPDTYGYLLFTLKKGAAEGDGEIGVTGFVKPEWWPAFIEMCNSSAQVGLDIARGN